MKGCHCLHPKKTRKWPLLAKLGVPFLSLLLGMSFPTKSFAQAEGPPFSRWSSANCPASGSCSVTFDPVPAGRIWLIKYVSCYTGIDNLSGRILYWYFYSNSKGGQRVGEIHLRPSSLGTSSPTHTYNATEQAYLRLPPEAVMGVTMARDSSTTGGIPFLKCSIGGNVIVQ